MDKLDHYRTCLIPQQKLSGLASLWQLYRSSIIRLSPAPSFLLSGFTMKMAHFSAMCVGKA